MIASRSPGFGSGMLAVEREEIAGLADRADHVGDDRGAAGAASRDRPDLVVRVVERRPDEVVHRRIDDHEGLAPRRASRRSRASPGCRHCRRSAGPARRSACSRDRCVARLTDRGIGVRDAAAARCRRDRECRGRRRDRRARCAWPSARSVRTKSDSSAKASSNGASSVIWLPICMSTPTTLMPGSLRGAGIDLARAADRDAELVLRLAGRDLGVGLRVDVGIDAQRDVRACGPSPRRSRTSSSSSGSDSTLKQRMPSSTASASSRAVLPTPENMIFSGGTPAASARLSSPSDTTSAPAPSRASVAITAWLEFAFMA